MAIDFYLDFITPFGYLARGRLQEIARRYGQAVHYHPVDIQRLRANAGSTGPSNSQIPAKLAYFTQDRERWADHYGLPIADTLAGYDTHLLNGGLYLAMERGQGDAYVEAAWNTLWRDGLDPLSPATVHVIETSLGWARGELFDFADTPDIAARIAADTDLASQRGVFGVPTFFVGKNMWWGNDRLDFLERHLASL